MLIESILAIDPGSTQSGWCLGSLCRRNHNHEGSGLSLRYSSGACVECQGENAKARRSIKGKEMDAKRVEWARKNPEKQAVYRARYQATHREARLAKSREWRKANMQKVAKAMAEYRKRNRERFAGYEAKRVRPEGFREAFNAYRREWAKKNPDKISEHASRRSGRKIGRLPSGTIAAIGTKQKWKCACCRVQLRKTGHHKDHIIPLAAGGPHARSNIQLLCPTCNLQKGAKRPEDFMRSRGFLL